ncbi:MAG: DNA-3-methyladenine glycosylase [Actinomycetota bacterium]|nr:DNA-3-methyladenine glycosylase [Actinomycetota bacterium]
MQPLRREFYRRDPRLVAPALLGKVLVAGARSGRIVEVEAYCGDLDPAAHSYRNRSARNEVMFGPAGHLYVYFTYGMHWCANAVCGEIDEGVAVLLRALAPLTGLDAMRRARGGVDDRDLCRGPARLCQALGLDRGHDGADLVTGGGGVWIGDDGVRSPADPVVTTRVGLSRNADAPWRWYVSGSRFVSRPVRG